MLQRNSIIDNLFADEQVRETPEASDSDDETVSDERAPGEERKVDDSSKKVVKQTKKKSSGQSRAGK